VTGAYDLVIYEGADFDTVFTWTANGNPVNLTGWSACVQIRTAYADTGAAVLADISSSGGGITSGQRSGVRPDAVTKLPIAHQSSASATHSSGPDCRQPLLRRQPMSSRTVSAAASSRWSLSPRAPVISNHSIEQSAIQVFQADPGRCARGGDSSPFHNAMQSASLPHSGLD
jgi:hypothetical protein